MELKAVLLNCTLKKSPAPSHTQGLLDIVIGHLHDLGVETEVIRPVDYTIPFGVDSDLGDGDEWPQILDKILAADILIMGMSIWFGVRSSVCQMVIERLDGTYNMTNDVGQYPMYNKVAGVVGSGEFLFPTEVLGAGSAPATARAGAGGALVMFGDRAIAQELLVTCPPLLEVFAGM